MLSGGCGLSRCGNDSGLADGIEAGSGRLKVRRTLFPSLRFQAQAFCVR